MFPSVVTRSVSPRFQGHLWINLSTDPRPVQQRLDEALDSWRKTVASGTVPNTEQEIIADQRSKGTMAELDTIIQKVKERMGEALQRLPRVFANRSHTQARVNYGKNEALRVELKQSLRDNGILYFDTEKTFICNLQALAANPSEPFASLEGRVGKMLLDRKLTLTTAESCTGGLISSRLTDVRGSGSFIKYADVVYCNDAKKEALGVPKPFLDAYGPYNEETARWMAEGSRKRSGADISVSITGLAGIYPEDGVPAGTAFVGIAGLTSETQVFRVTLPADLPKARKKELFSEYALFQLERLLKETAPREE